MTSNLFEGGNVFKKVEGGEVTPLTQRIATVDVQPTIDWINATFGFKFVDEDMLGTTGKKTKEDGTFEENSSGDLDLNVDVRELPKEEIIAKLTAWCQKQGIDDLEIMNKGRTFTQGWVANAGLQIHFKTPIRGDVKNGFVQTDFMLTDNPALQRGAKRGGTEHYTGADRAVLLSSLARGRGYKFSPTKGIVDPNNGDNVVADDWDEIAKILLGPNAREADTHTVESMFAKLKSDPDYEELIAPWKETMAKAGKEVPESTHGVSGYKTFTKEIARVAERSSIRAGLMIAEQRKDEGILGGIGKALQKGASAVKGGYAVGRGGSQSMSKMGKAYKGAGGPKTTIGQVAGIGTGIKGLIFGKDAKGNTVKVDPKNPKKDVKVLVKRGSRTEEVPFAKVNAYLKKDWQVIAVNESNKPLGTALKKKLKDEGGAAGFDPLKAVAKKMDVNLTPAMLKGMPGIRLHRDGDYILEASRIDHAEDLAYLQGSQGAIRALQSLRNMAKGGQGNVTLKWDGSPAVVFGRNENGEFVFTDKSGFVKSKGVGRTTSPDALKQELLMRSKGINKDDPKRIAFADSMAQAFGVFEKAVPKNYRGYFKGDLLYYNTPPVIEKNFVFKPQLVEYAVDVASDLGKKIAKSSAGVVVHRMVDPDGSEHPLKDLEIFEGDQLLVVPPVTIEQPAQVPNEELDRLAQIIKKDSADLDSLLDVNKLAQMKMKNFPDIIYKYMNSKVDTGLDNLGRDFTKWLNTRKDISGVKQQKIIEYIKQNMNAWTSLFEVITGIMKAKDSIIADLDKNPNAVKAKTDGKEGGEGYVLAHPEGDIKLVNRAVFTAANRAVQR